MSPGFLSLVISQAGWAWLTGWRRLARVTVGLAILIAVAAEARPVHTTDLGGVASRPVGDRYDVIVAGAGTGGLAAAIQAARLGSDVLLVEPTDWIGGQRAAAGVTSMDEGYPPRAHLRERGLYGEFWLRATAFYRALEKSTDTCAVSEDHFAVEPHVARRILEDMIRDTRAAPQADGQPVVLDLVTEAQVVAVSRAGNRVRGVTLEQTTPAGGVERIEIESEVLIDGFIPAEKNISQSRLASGATRLQPVTMLTGQAAGTIAALACRCDVAPRDVPPLLVQSALLDAGSTLSPVRYADVPHGTSLWKAVQLASLHGFLVSDGPEFQPVAKVKPADVEQVRQRLVALGSPAGSLQPLAVAANRGELVRVATTALLALASAPAPADRAASGVGLTDADDVVHDLVIYGGTSAAVMAAVQATRMGKSVVVVSPDRHLGGLSSGGLGMTDTGNKAVIGGLAREFYHRIWKHYERPEAWQWQARADYGNRGQGTPAIDGSARTMWVFEPHVAEQAFDDLVREHGITVVRDEWLERERGVAQREGRIESITTRAGNTYRGRMFLDATYEGDLMATAGVEYTVGREANATYGEEHNGVQVGVLHHKHHFGAVAVPISPYREPGDPTSGLLPLISPAPPGEFGTADRRVQAYCFRLCITTDPRNRLAIPRPQGYDPGRYDLLLRVLAAGWWEMFEKFDPIPNGKTDCNNHGPVGFDNIGMNYDYPEASYDRRREIIAEHQAYQLGLLWFLANDPRVPAAVQRDIREWGLAKDEFVDNGHWPHQIYVREARRMVGTLVMTENHLQQKIPTPDPIGMGSYTIDSHNVQRYVTPEGFVQNEGDIGVRLKKPYQIAYGAVVPKPGDAANLLVPVACSASHIAYGSIRMEPVFMILGQSAATAACLAIDLDTSVQKLPYELLRHRLRDDGQVLAAGDLPLPGPE